MDVNNLSLSKDLILSSNDFCYKQKIFNHHEINSLFFNYSIVSINFIKNEYCKLEVSHPALKSPLEIDSSSVFFTGKKIKDTQVAYFIFRDRSFNHRLKLYLEKLKNSGFLQIAKNTKLNIDGTIEKDGLKLSIRKAKENGTLRIGTSFYFGIEGSTNPYEVLVSETGMSAFSKRIIFENKRDHDVIQRIISAFSSTGS